MKRLIEHDTTTGIIRLMPDWKKMDTGLSILYSAADIRNAKCPEIYIALPESVSIAIYPPSNFFDEESKLPGRDNIKWLDCQDYSGYELRRISLPLEDKKYIKLLIELLNKYYSVESIKNEIYERLGMRKPEKEVTATLLAHFEQGDFKQAVDEAISYQKEGYDESIWTLADKAYEANQEPTPDLIRLYASISAKNTHYGEAQERLLILYGKDKQLDKQFVTALKVGENEMVDLLFHKLTGGVDCNAAIQNVGSPESILQIIGLLNQQQKTIEELKSQIKHLLKEGASINAEGEGPNFFQAR